MAIGSISRRRTVKFFNKIEGLGEARFYLGEIVNNWIICDQKRTMFFPSISSGKINTPNFKATFKTSTPTVV